MSTRSGARVYRRPPKPMADGTCPHCQRVIGVLESGRRRAHDIDGVRCTGSGIVVEGTTFTFDPAEVDAAIQQSLASGARWGTRDRTKPACRWSGKPLPPELILRREWASGVYQRRDCPVHTGTGGGA